MDRHSILMTHFRSSFNNLMNMVKRIFSTNREEENYQGAETWLNIFEKDANITIRRFSNCLLENLGLFTSTNLGLTLSHGNEELLFSLVSGSQKTSSSMTKSEKKALKARVDLAHCYRLYRSSEILPQAQSSDTIMLSDVFLMHLYRILYSVSPQIYADEIGSILEGLEAKTREKSIVIRAGGAPANPLSNFNLGKLLGDATNLAGDVLPPQMKEGLKPVLEKVNKSGIIGDLEKGNYTNAFKNLAAEAFQMFNEAQKPEILAEGSSSTVHEE